MNNMIKIALPKGRLGEKVYDIFEKAGFLCPEIKEKSRKLVFENGDIGVQYFWVKPSDVAVYVERGAADIGIVGYDVLKEVKADVYELLDLGIGKCDMAVAAPNGFSGVKNRPLKVATKYPRIARRYYNELGCDIDIIELHGSIELAPLLNLSDVIVDIVETGKTLVENGLEVVEKIMPISARIISNKASFRFNDKRIEEICSKVKLALEDNQ